MHPSGYDEAAPHGPSDDRRVSPSRLLPDGAAAASNPHPCEEEEEREQQTQ